MANESEPHFALVDKERSLERLRRAVDVLERSDVPYVVEGGWAVAAYGSPVPSVDLDILVDGELEPSVAERIEAATDIQIHAMTAQDQLGIDISDSRRPNALLATDLSYVPHDLLAGHVERRPITLLDGLELPVPIADRLAMMKLKAFHDRRLQWEATRERYRLAAFPQDIRERTLALGEPYWLRKSGKDLFDLAFLLDKHTKAQAIQQVTPPPLWSILAASTIDIPLPIRGFAADMATRSGTPFRIPDFTSPA